MPRRKKFITRSEKNKAFYQKKKLENSIEEGEERERWLEQGASLELEQSSSDDEDGTSTTSQTDEELQMSDIQESSDENPEYSDAEELVIVVDSQQTSIRSNEPVIVPTNVVEEFVREISVSNQLSHQVVRDMLLFFRGTMNYSQLPKDPRAVLRRGAIQLLHEESDIVYVGFKRALAEQCNVSKNRPVVIKFLINTDGLPLSRSSSLKFWPFLLSTNITREFVSVVSILQCRKNPNVKDLCRYFIEDLLDLLVNGFTYPDSEVTVPVELDGFVCDCPATATLMGIKGHGGYSACWKCTVASIENDGVCYIETSTTIPRTDAGFRNTIDPEHHNTTTPLIDIPSQYFDAVKHTRIDPFHVWCKGVVPRFIRFLRDPTRKDSAGNKVRPILPNMMWDKMGQMYSSMKFSREFSRKSRDLKEFDLFKASETRMMTLYGLDFLLFYAVDTLSDTLRMSIKCLCTSN